MKTLLTTIEMICISKGINYMACDIKKSDYITTMSNTISVPTSIAGTATFERHLVEMSSMLFDSLNSFENWNVLKYTDTLLINEKLSEDKGDYFKLHFGIIKNEKTYKAIMREDRINKILED